MGGSTGNIRTYRISACNGYRTLGSIIACGNSGAGGGSTRRMAAYYMRQNNGNLAGFYNSLFSLGYGARQNSPFTGPI